MEAAGESSVPAGGALAVDREAFSAYVHEKITTHPLITFSTEELSAVPKFSPEYPLIIATGPLTSASLAKDIERLTGQGRLSFFDAISPIILKESIDSTPLFKQSRWGKGGDDYINIPLSKEEYLKFIEEVVAAEKFGGHEEVESDSIGDLRPFEGCMPIEDMALRGVDTLRYGPLKPVGLTDPKTESRPYAVIQLRQDDKEGELWSMVGFQTRMKHPEQLRIFRSLPGLENAEFVRLGSVHRNSFIQSPKLLDATMQCRNYPGLFFAGQITGVEGYVESTASGLVAGLNAYHLIAGHSLISLPSSTAIGGLLGYVSDPEREYFQPMNISFGLIPSYFEGDERARKKAGKDARRLETSRAALEEIKSCQSRLFRL